MARAAARGPPRLRRHHRLVGGPGSEPPRSCHLLPSSSSQRGRSPARAPQPLLELRDRSRGTVVRQPSDRRALPSSLARRMVRSDRPGGVFLWLETPDPGWTLRIDGRVVSRLDSIGVIQAYPIGAGRHEVTATHRPAGMLPGALVTALTLGGLAAGRSSSRRRRKRRLRDNPDLDHPVEGSIDSDLPSRGSGKVDHESPGEGTSIVDPDANGTARRE